MVCSPEQARLNGSKSKGATSKRGKAIASRNATKHGLLAKQPPLLVTEDLASFEGIVQGLIDHYQPEGPTEHFLVQQIAMGMVRQHRLWSVEAAIANVEILKAQKQAQFAELVIPGERSRMAVDYFLDDQKIPLNQLWVEEIDTLKRLLDHFEQDLADVDGMNNEFEEWLYAVAESSGTAHFHKLRVGEFYKAQDDFDRWLAPCYRPFEDEDEKLAESPPIPQLEEVIQRIRQLEDLARERIKWLERQLKQITTLEASIQQAETTLKSLQQPELFSRYQRSINQGLYEAIDRLEEIQQRKNERSIGSFGQN